MRHLNQLELARRWALSPRTLERWRWQGNGPPFLKLGGRILYRLEDVLNWEAARLRASTQAAFRSLRPTAEERQGSHRA